MFVRKYCGILEFIATTTTLSDLIAIFIDKGGSINPFYLQTANQNRRSLVHLNGWHSGRNMKEAITKALAHNDLPEVQEEVEQ